jgi:SNF2 family DNA or RNA helicase
VSFFLRTRERIARFGYTELTSIEIPVFEQDNVIKEIELTKILIPRVSGSYTILTPRVESPLPALKRPEITVPFFTSFLKESLLYQDLDLGQTKISNVPDIFCEYPLLENIQLKIDPPHITGKNYVQRHIKRQEELFNHAEENYKFPVTSRAEREITTPKMDPFDLLKPLLYPPLNIKRKDNFFLKDDLKPWQPEGVTFLLSNSSALLADDMGLGKTIQTIVALKILFQKAEVKKCLILAKKSLLRNWHRELWDWAPELSAVIIASPTNQPSREILWNTPCHIYITNYENLLNDQNIWLKINDFDIVIFDEIQDLKNPVAEKTIAAKLLGAKWKWGLSGTPVENKIEDIHTIFSIVNPELKFGKNDSNDILKRTFSPYFLRRRADDIPDMPAVVKKTTWLDLSDTQRSEYDTVERQGINAIESQGNAATRVHIFALIAKLKRICNLAQNGESSKLENLMDKLDEIVAQENKALVFSQYPKETLEKLFVKLRRFKPVLFDGTLSTDQREQIVDSFQKSEDCKVLLLGVKSASLGITLTRANYVFHFDHWWNPAVANQATGRARRVGQKEKHVFEFSLYTSNTIEEKIYHLIERKRELFNDVIDDLSKNAVQDKLSDDDLFGLFGLKAPKSVNVDKAVIHENVSSPRSGNLLELADKEFEAIVAELFTKLGYDVRKTPRSNDGGVDIYAKGAFGAGFEHIMIQCKRYNLQNPVGRPVAQQMLGILTHDQTLTKAIIATTSRFTSQCSNFCEDKRIDLWDGMTVLRKLRDVGLWV